MSAPAPGLGVFLQVSGPDGVSSIAGTVEFDRAFWRYYFAGQALAGLGEAVWRSDPVTKGEVAERCTAAADALLAKLEAPSGNEGTP